MAYEVKKESEENVQPKGVSTPGDQTHQPQPITFDMTSIQKPTEYWGGSDDDIYDWIRTYEWEAKGWGWNESTMCKKLFLALKGKAAMKYDSMWGITEGITSWPRLKEVLIKTFKKDKTALREKRDAMKLTDEDDFDNHVAKMTQMCREINPYSYVEVN